MVVRILLCTGGKAVVEPDASSASYPFAVAAATGSSITVPHLNERSLQGDYGFVDVLAQMGCTVVKHEEWTKITGQTRPPPPRHLASTSWLTLLPRRCCSR